jgi:hypothetical protein
MARFAGPLKAGSGAEVGVTARRPTFIPPPTAVPLQHHSNHTWIADDRTDQRITGKGGAVLARG